MLLLAHPERFSVCLRGYHSLWHCFPADFDLADWFRMDEPHHIHFSSRRSVQFALIPLRSPLLRESRNWFLFLRLLRCFNSPRCPRSRADLSKQAVKSHSEILGSKAACASPKLIAACHVLHRLLEPSYPLSGLINKPTSGTDLICSICLGTRFNGRTSLPRISGEVHYCRPHYKFRRRFMLRTSRDAPGRSTTCSMCSDLKS